MSKKKIALLCTNRLDFRTFVENTPDKLNYSYATMTVETEDTIYRVIVSKPRGEWFDGMRLISVLPAPEWELIQSVKRCIRKYQP